MALLLKTLLYEGILMESLKDDFEVLPTTRQEVADFILQGHYLHRWPSATKHIYKVVNKQTGEIIGTIFYGAPVSPSLWRMFRTPEGQPILKPKELLEIQRIFIKDDAPKNLESFLIGQGNRKIKEVAPEVKVVSTYADPEQGHKGTIYQATNAIYLGNPNGKHLYVYVLRGDEKAIKQSMAVRMADYPK